MTNGVRFQRRFEREGQHGPPEAPSEIVCVLPLDVLQVAGQAHGDGRRQHGGPILLALSAAEDDLMPIEIDVFDAKLQAP